MEHKQSIAFLGIGLMGLPMAKHLLAAGYSVSVWNRHLDKAKPLAASGAALCDTAAEAIQSKQVIISMMTDGAVVQSLIGNPQNREAIQTGAIWIDMSSTKPDEAIAFKDSLWELGAHFIDAPVSGGTRGAEAASLAIMAGAEDEAQFAQVDPLLSVLGRPVKVGSVGSGQLAKLANQLIVGSTIAAVAEAMLLLEAGGADSAAVREALKGGFADSTILQQHGARMTSGDFTPGALSTLQLKDLNNILAVAASHQLSLPTTQLTCARYTRYIDELSGADKDHSGLYQELCDLNQLNP